ncbi:MAG: hypothetical protein OSJ66_09110 [Clostridia bacterium]|nr:hypothetical protein [Clostridia bacterium]
MSRIRNLKILYINIGKTLEYEVDFMAENPEERKYYQVTKSLIDDNVKMREIRSLESIGDKLF